MNDFSNMQFSVTHDKTHDNIFYTFSLFNFPQSIFILLYLLIQLKIVQQYKLYMKSFLSFYYGFTKMNGSLFDKCTAFRNIYYLYFF